MSHDSLMPFQTIAQDPAAPDCERSVAWGESVPAAWCPRERVVAIGVFDGLHVGHRFLIGCACDDARERGVSLLIVTFGRDPDEYFRNGGAWPTAETHPDKFKLMRNRDRLEALVEYGKTLDPNVPVEVLALPPTADLFEQTAQDFTAHLMRFSNPCSVHVGEGFRYGARAAGTTQTLAAWAGGAGVACKVHPLFQVGGSPVSSTRIRGLLAEGDVTGAAELLAGRWHSVWGHVVHGRGEGTGFGFATANLELGGTCRGVILPVEGVYGCYALVDDKRFAAAVNVGVTKSFEGATAPIEAHLLGFEGDLYGKDIELQFVKHLRPSRVFESTDELIETVTRDIDWVRDNLMEEA